jgi:hypothetical protein
LPVKKTESFGAAGDNEISEVTSQTKRLKELGKSLKGRKLCSVIKLIKSCRSQHSKLRCTSKGGDIVAFFKDDAKPLLIQVSMK